MKPKFVAEENQQRRKSHNQKIRDAHLQRTEEKQAEKQAKEEHQQAVKVAMERYKSSKQSRGKKLAKKTRRGQPVMKGQIELLLEKIQKQTKQE